MGGSQEVCKPDSNFSSFDLLTSIPFVFPDPMLIRQIRRKRGDYSDSEEDDETLEGLFKRVKLYEQALDQTLVKTEPFSPFRGMYLF